MDDVRNTLRQWGRAPLATALALASLTLGIGSTLALFSLVDALLLKTLPIRDPAALTRIVGRDLRPGEQHDIAVATHVWQHIRDHQTMFDSVLAVATDRANLAQGGETRYVGVAFVSDNYFDVLGLRPSRGRALQASDNTPATAIAAVISHSLWQREYGAADVIGHPIHLNGHRFTIVGVAPRGFFGLEAGRIDDVMVPLAAQDLLRGTSSQLRRRDAPWLQVFGRLRNPDAFASTRAQLASWYPSLREATAAGIPPERHLPYALDLVSAAHGRSFLRGQYTDALRVLLIVVTVLLAIAALNLAILNTARFADRRHEIGIRVAMGASRLRIARLLLTDSLLLAILAGAAGLWLGQTLAVFASRFMTVNRFAAVDSTLLLTLDARLVLAAVVVALTSALLAGLLPAWRATRVMPLEATREQPRGQQSTGTLRLMRTLAAGQVALSVALVVCAALLVRSFVQLVSRPTGVEQDRVLVAIVNDPLQPRNAAEVLQRIERTRGLLATVPGVTSVSAGLVTPLSGLMAATPMNIPGSQALPMAGAGPFNYVLPGFFDVLGTPLLMGRDFSFGDVAGGPGGGRSVVIVNQAFAHRHYGGFNPIGRRLLLGSREAEIIGVVANVRTMSLREDRDVAMAFAPLAQRNTAPNASLRWVLRTESPANVQHGVALALRALDPRIAVEFRTMTDDALSTISRERLLAWLGGVFAAIGLLVALVGIYGTFGYAVTRRRNEIGVRLALGARPSQIVAVFVRDGAVVVGVGLAIGVAIARGASRWMQSLLFGLDARDLETTLVACAAMSIVAAIATLIPARRAARTDPATTLRE